MIYRSFIAAFLFVTPAAADSCIHRTDDGVMIRRSVTVERKAADILKRWCPKCSDADISSAIAGIQINEGATCDPLWLASGAILHLPR